MSKLDTMLIPEDCEHNQEKKQWMENSMRKAYENFYRPAYYGTMAQPRGSFKEEEVEE